MKTFKNYFTEQENKLDDMEEKIIEFFMKNPYPDDNKVHKFAEDSDIDPHKLEKEIYTILSTFLSFGRFNEKGMKESDFNFDEIKKGIEIEYEHLDKKSKYADILAKRITLDHLSEIGKKSDYNTRLLKMEKEMEKI